MEHIRATDSPRAQNGEALDGEALARRRAICMV
jgi:hypothetical protein